MFINHYYKVPSFFLSWLVVNFKKLKIYILIKFFFNNFGSYKGNRQHELLNLQPKTVVSSFSNVKFSLIFNLYMIFIKFSKNLLKKKIMVKQALKFIVTTPFESKNSCFFRYYYFETKYHNN